ncbi:MAG: phage replisome organizer N-terminal domain-containing protein [Solobacterium sp.]|nr:phage replisome organizer N-terminal domain-containing protein [Solobacterium sp.]
MSDKKYYWIKLKTDFFDQDTIDFLMGQENGSKYVVIYQMLMLKTAQQGGVLATKANELLIPYDVKKIVRDTKYFDFDTVTIALELFKKLGLVYEEENHILRLTGAEQIVGSEWSSTERVRKYREKKALQCNTNVTKSNAQCNTDIDIDIDKDIDKDINNKIIYLLSSSKNIYIGMKLENEFNETLKMMIKAAQVTKKIPKQGRLEDLMKEMIFDRQDVSNKQGYLIECFKHEG